MGTFASKGENLGAKELNIPKWVWHVGWSYSNFAVDNSAVGIAHRLLADLRWISTRDCPIAMRKIDRYDKRRKTADKGVPDNDCR